MPMKAVHDLKRIIEAHREAGESWAEVLRVPSLSMGIYVLGAGAVDPQEPHTEDEVYYILEGSGMLRVGSEDHAFEPGSILFVPARAEHRYHDIQEDLVALVFFAPAEGSTAG
jgi:mannose-6-phosphate isomerase-like protein (cupin superfamily)